ncbi:MAG: hypothetical protein FWE90_12185 [Defluviitaleaceae bacterium]|nr:hypothetical protein [Defluviitaleaceae bacterium]MCL2605176.1 hypothetical protein [Defluviitaleaceae bacterium]
MIKLYQRIKLKSGKNAVIVEILGKGEAYIADIEISEGDYETETVYPKDIKSIYTEVEEPYIPAIA